jgi:hypothetical protein
MSSLQLWTSYYFQYKEVIDDSSLCDLSLEVSQAQKTSQEKLNNYPMSTHSAIGAKFSKTQGFFHNVVSQMKATMRSYNSPTNMQSGIVQDSELVRYKAVSPNSQPHSSE